MYRDGNVNDWHHLVQPSHFLSLHSCQYLGWIGYLNLWFQVPTIWLNWTPVELRLVTLIYSTCIASGTVDQFNQWRHKLSMKWRHTIATSNLPIKFNHSFLNQVFDRSNQHRTKNKSTAARWSRINQKLDWNHDFIQFLLSIKYHNSFIVYYLP